MPLIESKLLSEAILMKEIGSKNDLRKILKSKGRVYALFYASWCPFCRSFLPIFKRHIQKNDTTEFLQVNVDDESNPLWDEYEIEVVPTVILFDGERVAARLDGALGRGLSEEQLKDFIGSKHKISRQNQTFSDQTNIR